VSQFSRTVDTVIKIPVDGIRRAGRSTQGVIVMRLREDEQAATLARVVGSDDDAADESTESDSQA
jgi:DNA gyrase subunit A